MQVCKNRTITNHERISWQEARSKAKEYHGRHRSIVATVAKVAGVPRDGAAVRAHCHHAPKAEGRGSTPPVEVHLDQVVEGSFRFHVLLLVMDRRKNDGPSRSYALLELSPSLAQRHSQPSTEPRLGHPRQLARLPWYNRERREEEGAYTGSLTGARRTELRV